MIPRWLALGAWSAAALSPVLAACGRSSLDDAFRPDGAADGRDGGDVAEAHQRCPPSPPADDLARAAAWSFDFGDAAMQSGERVAFDTGGNVYLEGAFAGSVVLGGQELDAVGMNDHFVAKLDARGTLLWLRGFGGMFDVGDMKVTRQGTVVLGGRLDGPVTFLTGPSPSQTAHGLFVVTLDACGMEVRDTLLETTPGTTAQVSSLDVAEDGSVVVAGSFNGTISLGGGSTKGGDLGTSEHFVTKLANTGRPVWTRQLGEDVGFALVAVDAGGGTFIAAPLSGTLDLGGPPITAQGAVVAASLDDAGAPRWTRLGAVGDIASAYPVSAAVDADGDLLLAGGFLYGHNPGGEPGEFTLDFGGGIATDYVCCGDDGFVAAFAPGGQPLWMHGFGGASSPALVATNAGHTVAVSAQGDSAFNVAALGPTGDPTLLAFIQGGAPRMLGLDVDPAGRVVLTGSFYNDLLIDQDPMLIASPGLDWNGFVAKLAP